MMNSPTKKPAQSSTISVVNRRGTEALSFGPAFIPGGSGWLEDGSLRWSLMDGITSVGNFKSTDYPKH